jgi:hypothetical protein
VIKTNQEVVTCEVQSRKLTTFLQEFHTDQFNFIEKRRMGEGARALMCSIYLGDTIK